MMFKTKFELDKHVGKILMRARTDSDKNKEGLKIAKLYFDIKEYETADFYLTNYLSEFTFDAFAWKLKAEIAELSEKNWTKAIDYYIKSFKSNDESDSKLLLKICNCFIQTEKFDFVKAKEWLDRAIKMFPNDKIIINLQEKLFNNIELLGEKELNQWETFLIDAINENCSDQEVNLKFINISLKSKNYSKAFKHLIKIEYKSLFERDSKWSGFLFNLINSYIENQEEFNKFDKSTKLIFYLMAINYITSQIFGSIQKDDLLVLKQNFLRLDKFITKFESEKLLNLNENFGKIVYNEIISQYLYILGLLFLKHETNDTDDMSPVEKIFSNETKAGLFLMAKSLSWSKPNASFLSQDVSQKTRQDPILRLIFNDYVKLLHRESCWRYSSIGNWIKFLIGKKFSNDSSKILELIDFPKQNLKVHEVFTAFLNISQTNDFLICRIEHVCDSNISNIYETNTLDYADKTCLENQSFNLNYLIWHGLSSTNFSSKCTDLSEIPAYFFFRSTKNGSRSMAKFGVENLSICNLESLSLMDLKVFYYSVFYQALSILKSESGFALRPFWLETNLSNPYQCDWWRHSAQEVLRLKTSQNFMSSSLDDLGYFIKIDSKKQTEILRILELIRLKNPSVKIQTGIKSEIKYKIDLEIVILVAKYFQFLNDSIDCLNVSECMIERDTILQKYGQSFVSLNSESTHSPKEKQFYIKKYLLRYWNFTLKQSIKLKQVLYSVEDYMTEPLSETFTLNESTMNSTSQANQLNLYENYFILYKAQDRGMLSPAKLLPKDRPSSKDLKLFSPESTSLKSKMASPCFDSTIQTALLNSILIQTLPDYPADEMHNFQNLNEAINIFDLVEESLEKKWKNELNLYHLQVCKKLAETLVLQRDALISLKLKSTEGLFQRNMNENLNKIQTLIELTKNKINIGLKKPTSHDSIQTDRIMESINASFENSFIHDLVENGANTSITESIKNIEQFFEYKAENTPEAIRKREEYEEEQRLKEEQENAERKRIEEEEERKRLELEEKLKKEREEELKRQKELEELEKRKKEEKERQEKEEKEHLMKELKIHQEKIKKLEQDELLRWSKQKEEIEIEKIRLRNEINEEMNKKVKEFEAKQKKSADQMDSSYKSDKIIGLIDTLNRQRSQYFEMNKETLKEQFSFIKNQNTKINNEIKQLRLSANNRRKSLIEFKQIVTNFNEICDIKLYNSRFSIFYWLFQQNPNLAHSMWHQQNVMNEIKKCQIEKKSLIPEVKTPTRNQTKMNETSFLSVNEFQTPDTRLNQISFLEKPIGDIKFPSNFNVIEQLRKSADAFNSSQQSIENEEEEQYDSEEEHDDDDENFYNEDECYDDEEDYYDDENYEEEDEADCNRAETENTKQDTFLSCEDFDLTKSELSKVSMNELQILFSQNAYLYTYDIEKRLWMTKGKCKLEVIGDEISQKGDFKVHMICNLLDEKRVYEFDVTRFTNLNDFKNSNSAIYWFETKKALNNCCEPAGVRFENDSIKNEFKNLIEKCQKNMENNKSKLETRSSNSLLYPSDLLPEDLVGKFEKQITFILNENLPQSCVVLNITPIDKVYFLTIKQNDSVVFKHIITSDQLYEMSEKPKLRQYIFKYKISGDQVRVDYLSHKQSDETTVYDICLIFSSSPALLEFINVLNLKK